jgi:hypothetical protein
MQCDARRIVPGRRDVLWPTWFGRYVAHDPNDDVRSDVTRESCARARRAPACRPLVRGLGRVPAVTSALHSGAHSGLLRWRPRRPDVTLAAVTARRSAMAIAAVLVAAGFAWMAVAAFGQLSLSDCDNMAGECLRQRQSLAIELIGALSVAAATGLGWTAWRTMARTIPRGGCRRPRGRYMRTRRDGLGRSGRPPGQSLDRVARPVAGLAPRIESPASAALTAEGAAAS